MKTPVISLFFLFAVVACNNRTASDKIMEDFDSVSKSLEKVNENISQSTDALYDAVAKKYGESKLQQFYYQLNDCKGYLYDLKARFIAVCGDKTGNTLPPGAEDNFELTNEYFINKGKGDGLLAYLVHIQKVFLQYTGNDELKEKITALTYVPPPRQGEGFAISYFYNTPPVAALTIISKFENDIRNFERSILLEHLKK